MPIVHVPQRRTLDRWATLQRLFRFDGRPGGLRYRAPLEVRDAAPPEQPIPRRELRPDPVESGHS